MREVDLIIHILASLLEKYKVAVSALEDCLINTTLSAQIDIETVHEIFFSVTTASNNMSKLSLTSML